MVGQERRWISSFLSVAKKLSATALSKQSPFAAHRLGDAGGAGLLAEGERDELAALVGVPDQPRRRSAVGERHLSASVTSSVRM